MSWQQLQDILDDNRQVVRAERTTPPEACPIDGELLDVHPNGQRNCPMGNYRWERGLETVPAAQN